MEYSIKNGSQFGKAFKTDAGMAVVKPGKQRKLTLKRELTDEQIAAHDRAGVTITAAKAEAKAETPRRTRKADDETQD